MLESLQRHTSLIDIVGDVVTVRASGVALGDLAVVESATGERSLARAVGLDRDKVTLQVFSGTKGFSTQSQVQFLGRPMQVPCSGNVLGRVFRGSGEPRDRGPSLRFDPQIELEGPVVNPVMRVLPARMIRTGVPMIDMFNCLVESQKIPIFSVAGEGYDSLLARIGFQTDADIVVFGGMGLIFDDYHFFRTSFEQRGVFHRTVMFVNLAADPVIERLLVPDAALAVAERFAVDEGKRVLVLLTDMTAFADALKEVGLTLERIPANRGYLGDLYSQLAMRYEKACDFRGAGSVTVLSVTTMPGKDITHPVPDNTGYITEGQIYLHDGIIDPFGSLSRLKQNVIGKVTREDHGALANAMIRLYAAATEAERKRAMAFELSARDERLLAYGEDFRKIFMDAQASMPLETALDRGWRMLASHFSPDEILVRADLIERYYPHPDPGGAG
jgi:V/A-type H+-transporting ATPase subunit B